VSHQYVQNEVYKVKQATAANDVTTAMLNKLRIKEEYWCKN